MTSLSRIEYGEISVEINYKENFEEIERLSDELKDIFCFLQKEISLILKVSEGDMSLEELRVVFALKLKAMVILHSATEQIDLALAVANRETSPDDTVFREFASTTAD